MTVQIDRRSKTHRGNGIATVFPYDFPIPDAESVRVWVFDETNNTRTDLSQAQYSITGLGEADFGNVTYPLAGSPLPATRTLTIAREVPYTQDMDIQNQGGFYPEVLEDQLDRIVMQIQQVVSEAEGALRAQPGETFERLPPKSALRNTFLGFDSFGEPYGAQAISLGAATFATEAEARAGVSTTVLMSPLRTFQAIQERSQVILPEDYIGDATSLASVTAGLQTFFNVLAAEGGTGRLSQWYPINGPIVVSSTAQPFIVEGAGKYVSGLRRSGAGQFTVLDVTGDDFVLRDFGIDGGRSTFASSGMHGVRLLGSRWGATNLYVTDVSGIGIFGAAGGTAENLNVIRDCHVDGTGGAQRGIWMDSQVDGVVSGCFVENVHSSSGNVGINLVGCSSTAVANCKIRNCFTGVQTVSGSLGVGSNNQISDVLITSPNSSSSSGSTATGVRLNAGSSLAVNGLAVDGGNEDGFIAVQIDNDPDGGAAVSFRASNCAGVGSYVLKIVGTSYSMVTISSIFGANDKFVHLTGDCRRNTVLLGRREGQPIYAPWRHVQNDAPAITNLVQMLQGDITHAMTVEDDEAVDFPVVDGGIGILEVTTGGSQEWFRGFVSLNASPFIQGDEGTNMDTGTTALTTGTSDGTDGKMNVHVTPDNLFIKNRMGAARTVLFKLVMG